jgi:signal peptidase I
MKNNKKISISLRSIGNLIYGLIFTILIFVAGIIAISSFKIPGNYKIYSVQSGSMEPAIHKGAVVLVKPETNYHKGDVITVFDPANPKVSVTHRVFDIKTDKGQVSYVTKGDANKTADTEFRPSSSVVGKVLFSIPLIGYPISFAKTRDGLIILIIIPATLIIYSELLTIKNETVKLLVARKNRKLTLSEKIEVEIGEEEMEVEKGFKKLWSRLFKKREV